MRYPLVIILLVIAITAAVLTAMPQLRESRLLSDIADRVRLWDRSQEVFTPGPLRLPLAPRGAELSTAGVLAETNHHRNEAGLTPLARNTTLDQAAQLKVDDMFARQYFEHVAPDGTGPADLVERVGYQYLRVGENLALGNFASDAALVTAWMDSPGHRENILKPGFSEIGIAVGRGEFEGRSAWLAVQTFALPASACPTPDVRLETTIEAERALIEQESADLEAKSSELTQTAEHLQQLQAEIIRLAREGNEKIAAGNAEIRRGNMAAARGDEEEAEAAWERGKQLQAEGQMLLDEAKQLEASYQQQAAAYEAERATYNTDVQKLNERSQQLQGTIATYNSQVAEFNTCLK